MRSYLTALAAGEESFATGYLRRGLPNETFVNSGARFSLTGATQTGPGTFLVTMTIESNAGRYNEAFTLANGPNGLQITDHTATAIP